MLECEFGAYLSFVMLREAQKRISDGAWTNVDVVYFTEADQTVHFGGDADADDAATAAVADAVVASLWQEGYVSPNRMNEDFCGGSLGDGSTDQCRGTRGGVELNGRAYKCVCTGTAAGLGATKLTPPPLSFPQVRRLKRVPLGRRHRRRGHRARRAGASPHRRRPVLSPVPRQGARVLWRVAGLRRGCARHSVREARRVDQAYVPAPALDYLDIISPHTP